MNTKFTTVAAVINERLDDVFQKVFHPENTELFFPVPPLDITDEVIALTLRGGKRLRAALMVAGYELLQKNAIQNDALLDAACAMELLQSYFLIHDDIMDGDTVRRGGPSVHASLQQKVGNAALGMHLGILAGDLACATHEWLLARLQCPAEQRTVVLQIFSRMHMDVVFGQALDLQGNAAPEEIVQRKTAAYTTIGPLCCGAALGGATESQLRNIAAIARPMGIAFQYRDDFIGLFGDPLVAGKPVGSDLRNKKRTALMEDALAHLNASDRKALRDLLDVDISVEGDVLAALSYVEKSGARERCEARIQALVNDVATQLSPLPFLPSGKEFVLWLCGLLAHRIT